MPKEKRLSKKERDFVKKYIETGNGVQSALGVYNTEKYHTAGEIAYQNLKKPKIQNAIREALSDELLAQKHNDLLNQKRLDYFVFPRNILDEEIIEQVEEAGLKVVNIAMTDKGKRAFYSVDDAQAIKSALDMAYKLRGDYAPIKTANLNINYEQKQKAKSDIRDYLDTI